MDERDVKEKGGDVEGEDELVRAEKLGIGIDLSEPNVKEGSHSLSC